MSTVARAYSVMQSICDHAFESAVGKVGNQSRFSKLNIALLRSKLADVIADPSETNAMNSTAASFNIKNDYQMMLNTYQVSEGTLPSLIVGVEAGGNVGDYALQLYFPGGAPVSAPVTYQDIVDALGVQRGDQLTFIQLGHNYAIDGADSADAFSYARVILEPASGDMSENFLDPATRTVNDPNPRNVGDVRLVVDSEEGGIVYYFPAMAHAPAEGELTGMYGTVILSRYEGGKWRRSSQSLEWGGFNGGQYALDKSTFGLAYASYLSGVNSGLYLNAAETPAPAPAVAPASISSVVAGRTVNQPNQYWVMDSGEGCEIRGENLTNGEVVVKTSTSETPVSFTTQTATQLVFNCASGVTYRIFLRGEIWGVFTNQSED